MSEVNNESNDPVFKSIVDALCWEIENERVCGGVWGAGEPSVSPHVILPDGYVKPDNLKQLLEEAIQEQGYNHYVLTIEDNIVTFFYDRMSVFFDIDFSPIFGN